MKCRDLNVWQRSVALSSQIYTVLADLKDYGFKDQITRSGLSVPSNIAEGIERVSEKEARVRSVANRAGEDERGGSWIALYQN